MALLKLEMAAGKKESAPLAVSANNKGAGGRMKSSHEITHFLVDLEDTDFV